MADLVPGVCPGCCERSHEQHGDLGGDEGDQAVEAPAAVDEAEPGPQSAAIVSGEPGDDRSLCRLVCSSARSDGRAMIHRPARVPRRTS
jgi:hypothetical protein